MTTPTDLVHPLEPIGHQALEALVLDRLATQACDIVGAEQSWILVRDRDDMGMAIAAAASGVGEELLGTRVTYAEAPVEHALAFDRFVPRADGGAIPQCRAGCDGPLVVVSVPIGRPARGTLSAASSAPGRQFSPGDHSLLQELAALANDALGHAATRNRRADDLRVRLGEIFGRLVAHEPETASHSFAVVGIAMALGLRLGLSKALLLELDLAALLHDVGKVAVPERILSKPGPLEESERRLVEQHPHAGAEILRGIPGLGPVATIVRHHHERWDGRGYPDRLGGECIPLASRIVALCDAFHAMVSVRPYRAPLDRNAALGELRANAGSQFDPRLVEVFDGALADASLRSERYSSRQGSCRS